MKGTNKKYSIQLFDFCPILQEVVFSPYFVGAPDAPECLQCAWAEWTDPESPANILGEALEIQKRTSELLLWDLRRQEVVEHLIAEFGITETEAHAAVTYAQEAALKGLEPDPVGQRERSQSGVASPR